MSTDLHLLITHDGIPYIMDHLGGTRTTRVVEDDDKAVYSTRAVHFVQMFDGGLKALALTDAEQAMKVLATYGEHQGDIEAEMSFIRELSMSAERQRYRYFLTIS